jgi:hypothetical protein
MYASAEVEVRNVEEGGREKRGGTIRKMARKF